MMNRFWEAFNKPNAFRTGPDEFVLTVVGFILAVVFVGLLSVGFLIYLSWKDKVDNKKNL